MYLKVESILNFIFLICHVIAIAQKGWAANFMDALFRVLVMAVGELDGWDEVPKLDKFETSGEKWTLYLGRMCLMAFVFLFMVVLLNLLNAIAIGDVQVPDNIAYQPMQQKHFQT